MAPEHSDIPGPSNGRSDRFATWPLYSGLAVVAFCCFVMWWPVAQRAFTIILFLWAVPFALIVLGLAGAVICCGVAAARQRRWRRLVSMLAFPILLPVSIPASYATGYVANWLTFIAHKGSYLAEVQKARTHLRLFDWGGNPMIGVDRFVVWDEEDQIVQPEAQQSQSWKELFQLSRYRIIQEFGSHFYLIEY